MERNIFSREPQFSKYFQRHIKDDMSSGMLLSIRTKGGLKDDIFYNNVQESNNFVFKSKIKEKKATESVGYRPVLKCTWREAILITSIRDFGSTILERHSTGSAWKRSICSFHFLSAFACKRIRLV